MHQRRSDGPAQARAGFQRPSRPIAPERPATAAGLVRVPDRASLIRENPQVRARTPSTGAGLGRSEGQICASGVKDAPRSGGQPSGPGADSEGSGEPAAMKGDSAAWIGTVYGANAQGEAPR